MSEVKDSHEACFGGGSVTCLGPLEYRIVWEPAPNTERKTTANEFPWGSSVWHRRLAVAASMMPIGACDIADIGAGKRDLLKYLREGIGLRRLSYTAYDKAPVDLNVSMLDLDTEVPPVCADVVFCLGVLEYLKDPHLSLSLLKATAPWLICSARRVSPNPKVPRVNSLGINGMKLCVEGAGWIVCDERVLEKDAEGVIEKVWLARRREE